MATRWAQEQEVLAEGLLTSTFNFLTLTSGKEISGEFQIVVVRDNLMYYGEDYSFPGKMAVIPFNSVNTAYIQAD